ncbi:hypothetical protein COU78_01840 [Candidatus Peregrinibacteria bacterium CG10_big_fil_rev_8_21_14_0_10_49_24]|nr:MAG: hypothetical protein COV83_05950 [Candidatus Peregrinibacteria bacterium CG11_big_fil_rev_8_21_14_0_20_49_14]PIR51309.1 MAG: hypothetical protein COU78_01840 [Candidatus Peregrinibacteria bacterium CG10_big_fil_rev_8_21_14_0_10_49_24]PJA67414.1 MAG: hypothetical protein CO157_04690 [Candidatus Peregrinibacteria bacterium CG_4_9_14_3_um_filter_49_12]
MPKRFPVVWLTGNTGAGKSTLAEGMREYFNEQEASGTAADRRIVVLDGDEMRATVSRDEGLSPEDRRKHNLRVARLANLLSEHGFLVLVAVIAPFSGVREELQVICDPKWVYVKRSGLGADDRPYEEPLSPDFLIDNDSVSIEEGRELLSVFIRQLATETVSVRQEAEAVVR